MSASTKHSVAAFAVASIHAFHPALDLRDSDPEVLRWESRSRQARWADWRSQGYRVKAAVRNRTAVENRA